MHEWDPNGSNLIFIFGPPRAGSTMLQLMLESHSRIAGGPEPHVMVPLRFAGYFAHPEKANYNILNASLGLQEFVKRLPDGEEDYLAACRAYAGTLYQRAAAVKPTCQYYIDKTPPNVLEWGFITKVFPAARYLVLVRHPLAVLDSFAGMSFMGDYALAHAERPILTQYIPATAEFIRLANVNKVSVCYEHLVFKPEHEMTRILDSLGLQFEPAVVDYGRETHHAGSVGDQIQAYRLDRPNTASMDRWREALRVDPGKRDVARGIVEQLPEEDLATCGYPKDTLIDELDSLCADQSGTGTRRRRGRRRRFHHFKRRMYFGLRGLARSTALGSMLRRLRYYCDVLLRE